MRFLPLSPCLPIARRLLVALLIMVPFIAALAMLDLKQESDITKFLPENDLKSHLRISQLFNNTNLSRSMILEARFPDGTPSELKSTFSDRLARTLMDTGLFRKVRNGSTEEGQERLFYELYFRHRFGLYSLDPDSDIPRLFRDEGLNAAIRKLVIDLRGPMGMAIKRIASADPLQVFSRSMQWIQSASTSVSPAMLNGRFVSPDNSGMLIVAETIASPFENSVQRGLIAEIRRKFDELAADVPVPVRFDFTGINRFSLDAERLILRDINIAFFLSTAVILIVFRHTYRSFRITLLAFIPLFLGVLVSIGLSSLIFGKLHGLTIAFGSSLIGISDDYSIHIINHFSGRKPEESSDPLDRSLHRSLLMCFVTTFAGYFIVGFSDFPGIRQMAVSSMIGLAYAFLFSVVLLPDLVMRFSPKGIVARKQQRHAALLGFLKMLHRRRLWMVAVFVAASLFAVAELSHTRIYTDIRMLNSSDPETRRVDEHLQSCMKSRTFESVLAVSGAGMENALVENERVCLSLDRMVRDQSIQAYFSPIAFIRSESLQKQNISLFRTEATPDRLGRSRSMLETEGFDPARFEPFMESIRNLSTEVLKPGDLLRSSLGDLISGFVIEDAGETHILNLLRSDLDPAQLNERLGGSTRSRVFRQVDLMNDAITSSQSEITRLTVLGLVVITLILWVYYRSMRKIIAGLLPALFAAMVTIATIGLFAPSLNMMHVVSILLILSMGVDYGIFLTDSSHGTGNAYELLGLSTYSVIITSITTLASFGSLVFTNNGALRSIGIAVSAGITCAAIAAIGLNTLLLAPVKHEK